MNTWTFENLEWLTESYLHSNVKDRLTILKIFGRVGGWDSLGGLLLAVSDIDHNIQDLAWDFLRKWKDKSMRLFTTPSMQIKQHAITTYEQTDASKLNLTNGRSRLWNELRHYVQ